MQRYPVLKDIGAPEFLKRYWQKKPLLIRKAFSQFPALLSPDELAGLGCESGVDARIISESNGKWAVQRGPFRAATFKRLPAKKWTLLVNGVDRLIPEVHRLMDHFSFIPNWRLDDIMISYAVDGGNVGAHVDNFDVFLIQALGRREWRIEMAPQLDDNFRPGMDIKLLKKFRPAKTWVLEPGDMLYLPPRFAHHGIARGDDCMTYSIGFRAPSAAELLDGAATHALATLQKSVRYQDPDLQLQHPGEIRSQDLKRLREAIVKAIPDDDSLAEWFGAFITASGEPLTEGNDTGRRKKFTLPRGASISRSENAKVAYARQRDGEILLFANGDTWRVPASALSGVQLLTGGIDINSKKTKSLLSNKAMRKIILDLIARGIFRVSEK